MPVVALPRGYKRRSRFASKKAEPRPPTADDLFLVELREECAKAIIAWLKQAVDVKRPIKTLTPDEFRWMAEACTAKWIQVVSQRLAKGDAPPQAQEYRNLLMG